MYDLFGAAACSTAWGMTHHHDLQITCGMSEQFLARLRVNIGRLLSAAVTNTLCNPLMPSPSNGIINLHRLACPSCCTAIPHELNEILNDIRTQARKSHDANRRTGSAQLVRQARMSSVYVLRIQDAVGSPDFITFWDTMPRTIHDALATCIVAGEYATALSIALDSCA